VGERGGGGYFALPYTWHNALIVLQRGRGFGRVGLEKLGRMDGCNRYIGGVL
jgi:hypothetical protein